MAARLHVKTSVINEFAIKHTGASMVLHSAYQLRTPNNPPINTGWRDKAAPAGYAKRWA
jgi:hypothetical protein